MDLKIPGVTANVICAGIGCNGSFAKRGNRLYCSEACRKNARRVQDRRRKRAERLPQEAEIVAQRAARERELHLAAMKSGKRKVSADRAARRFRLPLRRLQRDRAPARRRTGSLLLQILPGGLPAGLAAVEPSAYLA